MIHPSRYDLAVVIPTYNRADTVGRAIESVLSSVSPGVQVVVVNDGSTDRTADMLSRCSDCRLTVIDLPSHTNANVARNCGIAASEAPVIAFLDSDDEFRPGRAERLLRFFTSRPDVDAVLDGFEAVGKARRKSVSQPAVTMTGGPLTDLLIAHAVPLTCSAIAARQTALDEIGGFDESLVRHQDRDLLLRLASRHRVALGTGKDCVKHQRADSVSRLTQGYTRALDELAARHPIFTDQEHHRLLGYLVARGLLKPLFSGQPRSALSELRDLNNASELNFGLLHALALYLCGYRERRRIERALRRLL